MRVFSDAVLDSLFTSRDLLIMRTATVNQRAVTVVLTGQPTGMVHTCTLLLIAHTWLMSMSAFPLTIEITAEPLLIVSYLSTNHKI